MNKLNCGTALRLYFLPTKAFFRTVTLKMVGES